MSSPIVSVAERLLANVDAQRGDFADDVMRLPVERYLDPERYQREVEMIFHRSPLLVALSCDIRQPGDFSSLTIAGRPLLVVRGDDGVARTFLNICSHRGAPVTEKCFGSSRRFTCPYHFWVYDTQGSLVGNTAREAFDGADLGGLTELPTAERSGAIFAVLTPGAPMDIDEWLGEMADALAMLKLDTFFRHRDGLGAESGNWKATADGYVDGYHLGYLHRNTIGAKSITNRNTYDFFGPHVRLGFANKPLLEQRDEPSDQWRLREVMSLVHYVFPNISISGLPQAGGLMMSRIYPGSSVDRCWVEQFQYFSAPMDDPGERAIADGKRELYYDVTKDEDFATVIKLTDAMKSNPDGSFWFGRNEPGNQNLHRWVERLTDGVNVMPSSGAR